MTAAAVSIAPPLGRRVPEEGRASSEVVRRRKLLLKKARQVGAARCPIVLQTPATTTSGKVRKPRRGSGAPARPGVEPPPRSPPPANQKLVTWYRSLGASLKSRLLLRVPQHFTSDLGWFPSGARSNDPAKLAEMCGANARGVHSVTWMWIFIYR